MTTLICGYLKELRDIKKRRLTNILRICDIAHVSMFLSPAGWPRAGSGVCDDPACRRLGNVEPFAALPTSGEALQKRRHEAAMHSFHLRSNSAEPVPK